MNELKNSVSSDRQPPPAAGCFCADKKNLTHINFCSCKSKSRYKHWFDILSSFDFITWIWSRKFDKSFNDSSTYPCLLMLIGRFIRHHVDALICVLYQCYNLSHRSFKYHADTWLLLQGHTTAAESAVHAWVLCAVSNGQPSCGRVHFQRARERSRARHAARVCLCVCHCVGTDNAYPGTCSLSLSLSLLSLSFSLSLSLSISLSLPHLLSLDRSLAAPPTATATRRRHQIYQLLGSPYMWLHCLHGWHSKLLCITIWLSYTKYILGIWHCGIYLSYDRDMTNYLSYTCHIPVIYLSYDRYMTIYLSYTCHMTGIWQIKVCHTTI